MIVSSQFNSTNKSQVLGSLVDYRSPQLFQNNKVAELAPKINPFSVKKIDLNIIEQPCANIGFPKMESFPTQSSAQGTFDLAFNDTQFNLFQGNFEDPSRKLNFDQSLTANKNSCKKLKTEVSKDLNSTNQVGISLIEPLQIRIPLVSQKLTTQSDQQITQPSQNGTLDFYNSGMPINTLQSCTEPSNIAEVHAREQKQQQIIYTVPAQSPSMVMNTQSILTQSPSYQIKQLNNEIKQIPHQVQFKEVYMSLSPARQNKFVDKVQAKMPLFSYSPTTNLNSFSSKKNKYQYIYYIKEDPKEKINQILHQAKQKILKQRFEKQQQQQPGVLLLTSSSKKQRENLIQTCFQNNSTQNSHRKITSSKQGSENKTDLQGRDCENKSDKAYVNQFSVSNDALNKQISELVYPVFKQFIDKNFTTTKDQVSNKHQPPTQVLKLEKDEKKSLNEQAVQTNSQQNSFCNQEKLNQNEDQIKQQTNDKLQKTQEAQASIAIQTDNEAHLNHEDILVQKDAISENLKNSENIQEQLNPQQQIDVVDQNQLDTNNTSPEKKNSAFINLEKLIERKNRKELSSLFHNNESVPQQVQDEARSSRIEQSIVISKESTILLKDIYQNVQTTLKKYDNIIKDNQHNKQKIQKVVDNISKVTSPRMQTSQEYQLQPATSASSPQKQEQQFNQGITNSAELMQKVQNVDPMLQNKQKRIKNFEGLQIGQQNTFAIKNIPDNLVSNSPDIQYSKMNQEDANDAYQNRQQEIKASLKKMQKKRKRNDGRINQHKKSKSQVSNIQQSSLFISKLADLPKDHLDTEQSDRHTQTTQRMNSLSDKDLTIQSMNPTYQAGRISQNANNNDILSRKISVDEDYKSYKIASSNSQKSIFSKQNDSEELLKSFQQEKKILQQQQELLQQSLAQKQQKQQQNYDQQQQQTQQNQQQIKVQKKQLENNNQFMKEYYQQNSENNNKSNENIQQKKQKILSDIAHLTKLIESETSKTNQLNTIQFQQNAFHKKKNDSIINSQSLLRPRTSSINQNLQIFLDCECPANSKAEESTSTQRMDYQQQNRYSIIHLKKHQNHEKSKQEKNCQQVKQINKCQGNEMRQNINYEEIEDEDLQRNSEVELKINKNQIKQLINKTYQNNLDLYHQLDNDSQSSLKNAESTITNLNTRQYQQQLQNFVSQEPSTVNVSNCLSQKQIQKVSSNNQIFSSRTDIIDNNWVKELTLKNQQPQNVVSIPVTTTSIQQQQQQNNKKCFVEQHNNKTIKQHKEYELENKQKCSTSAATIEIKSFQLGRGRGTRVQSPDQIQCTKLASSPSPRQVLHAKTQQNFRNRQVSPQAVPRKISQPKTISLNDGQSLAYQEQQQQLIDQDQLLEKKFSSDQAQQIFMNFQRRNQEWQDKKQDRLKKQQIKLKKNQMQECTFMPQTNGIRSSQQKVSQDVSPNQVISVLQAAQAEENIEIQEFEKLRSVSQSSQIIEEPEQNHSNLELKKEIKDIMDILDTLTIDYKYTKQNQSLMQSSSIHEDLLQFKKSAQQDYFSKQDYQEDSEIVANTKKLLEKAQNSSVKLSKIFDSTSIQQNCL